MAQPGPIVFTRLWARDPSTSISSQPQSSSLAALLGAISTTQIRGPVFTRLRTTDPGAAITSQPQSSPTVLIATVQSIPVSFQYDWPNPRWPARGVSLLWNGASTPSTLLTQIIFPTIAQYDWPVPKGYVPGVYLRWAGQGTPSSFIPATGTPVSKSFSYDWPNPRGPVGNAVLRTIATAGTNPNLLPPPKTTVVYAKQFFATMGGMMSIPGDPPS